MNRHPPEIKSHPALSAAHVDRLETMEDFQREEQRLSDSQAFDNLVGLTRKSESND